MQLKKLDLTKAKEYLAGIPLRVKSAFLIQDGEKRRLNFKLLGIVIVPLVVAGSFMSTFKTKSDTSYLDQGSDRPKSMGESLTKNDSQSGTKPVVHSSLISDQPESKPIAKAVGHFTKIKYGAKQVIDRFAGMPAGSNFIGKLLTAIDTRDKGQIVKVLLPYGATFQGTRNIESGSTLFGSAQHSGSGEKVYLQFNRLVRPDGAEYKLQAQALSSKDFSPGLSGELYTNADSRIMATIGLSMLAAGADVMVEKEALGNSAQPTPKATLKNAAITGFSKGTQMEGERQLSQAGSQEEYVIVETGTEMVISLTEAFKGESTTENQR